MSIRASVLAAFVAAPAGAQEPLSVIDWLDGRDAPPVAAPVTPPPNGAPGPAQSREEPPVAASVDVPEVDAQPLDAPSVEAVGLLPAHRSGLPPSLWSASDGAALSRLVASSRADLPAIAALLNTLLLAEAHPPRGVGDGARFLAARVARLIEGGAVDPALALLERAGPQRADLFPLWLDAALLEGNPAGPCEALSQDAGLSDDLAATVYCAARQGDWPRAMLTFESARSLDLLEPRDADLLSRFLEPEFSEDLPALPPPVRPSVLQFRLFEAIGEPLPTARLPRAFAATDLGGDQGWKAQLTAAERLARAGTLSENRLLGIYSLRQPAASGGIWDRVEALQRFDIAMTARNPTSVATALTRVWPEMAAAGLLVPFATLYAERLLALPLTGDARRLAIRAGFLSPVYERAASLAPGSDAEAAFLASIARGEAPGSIPDLPHAAAIAGAFAADAAPPSGLQRHLQNGQLGEAILRAIALFAQGAAGNDAQLTDALATFRAVGLEDTARRAALQLALLDDMRGGQP
ncbi:hypothetical protein SAMN05421759_103262 [Roseivivax lentus]|uniref:Antifreeze glycopeptide polyprotein n=1 Tax=Roseivivax lentus TaxID=633194 RepID=A0A1N7LYG5_9RHOB|nr:hypothetical protein [Roseivivax lentus]SIS78751.1 hypothetical protein SAMN05421759_103262 [Roseivivax lentus]